MVWLWYGIGMVWYDMARYSILSYSMVVWYGIVWCVWYSIVGIGLKVKSHGLCITWEQDTLRLTSSLCPWWFHSGPHYGCRLWFPQCEVATQAKDHGKYVRLLSSQIAKVSIHQGNIDTFESWIFHCAWDSNHYILIWSTDSWVSSYIWVVLYGIVYNFIFSPENLTLYILYLLAKCDFLKMDWAEESGYLLLDFWLHRLLHDFHNHVIDEGPQLHQHLQWTKLPRWSITV